MLKGAFATGGTDRLWVWSTVLLALSLAVNVALGIQLKTLRAKVDMPQKGGIQVGRKLLKIDVLSAKDEGIKLDVVGSLPTVLYVFSPVCQYCEQDCGNISTIARGTLMHRFIGISTQKRQLDQFLKKCQLPFPVFTATSSTLIDRGDLNATPQTVVLSQDGIIQRNWVGMLTGERRDEADAFFSVHRRQGP